MRSGSWEAQKAARRQQQPKAERWKHRRTWYVMALWCFGTKFFHRKPPWLHLFGHTHAQGGEMSLTGGTLFVNGATTVRLLEV